MEELRSEMEYDLHAVLDGNHSEDWKRKALRSAVAEDPRRATGIAEGALIPLRCGERRFDRCRSVLLDDSRR